MKFTTELSDIGHLTLSRLLHYLGKLKIQIFCRYSADIEENANKLHANKLHFNRLKLQCLSTIKMVFSNEDKILIKKLVFEGACPLDSRLNY